MLVIPKSASAFTEETQHLSCLGGASISRRVCELAICSLDRRRIVLAEMLQQFAAAIPMGRRGSAAECAGAFLFLADGAASSYVTGQIIEVNGGQVMP
jgi:NAD(P)-dependent dehydrogenase (short-subunit alcohol dehydrogenase family)